MWKCFLEQIIALAFQKVAPEEDPRYVLEQFDVNQATLWEAQWLER